MSAVIYDEDAADLADADVESIYGYEAVRDRTRRRLDAIERHADALIARMDAGQAALQRALPSGPSPRAWLHGSPEGIQRLRESIEQLLATGDLWWQSEA